MTVITGGLVAYEDGIKANEEYAPAKKARAELRFDVPEGADAGASLDYAMALAQNQVLKMLGSKRAPGTVAPAANLVAPLADGGGSAAPNAAPVKTKADLAKEAGLTPPTKAPKKTKKVDPDEITTETTAPAADEFDIPAKAEPISDADLAAAVGKKNAALGDPQLIRDLIGTYNPTPGQAFQMRQIPLEHRPHFLEKLEALKPIAKAATR